MLPYVSEPCRVEESLVPSLVHQWLGPREWSGSGPLPLAPRLAIVSSRLPRLLDSTGPWLEGLRGALEYVHSRCASLVVAAGTAGQGLILRGAERLQIPTLCLVCEDGRVQSGSAGQPQRPPSFSTSRRHQRTTLWGLTLAQSAGEEAGCELGGIPERDRAVFSWSNQIIALSVRSQGNVHKLLRHRLAVPGHSILLVDLPGLHGRRVTQELAELGAVLWKPGAATMAPQIGRDSSTAPGVNATATCPEISVTAREPLDLSRMVTKQWNLLTHTTRGCAGPWPSQSLEDYWDSLLDARPDSDHTPLAALFRIVAQRRLIASSRAIRGGHPVVCFTELPIWELPRLRTFRAHRSRWDFEPYGICIRRDWLEARAARPVHYGDESLWSQLDPAQQPFFQRVREVPALSRPSQPKAGKAVIDWSVEREWRIVGDLDLGSLSEADAFLFVKTAAEAARLLEISPWPVTVLGNAPAQVR